MVTWHAALGADLGARTGLAGGVVSCVQPADRLGTDPLLHPFLEFTALAASRAGIDHLLRLDTAQLPECPAAAERGEKAEDEAAALAADPAAVLAADGLTAAEAEAMRTLRAWSASVLAGGLGLSSLAVRQRGVDWADRQMWTCNGGISPLTERGDDGQSVAPYEAMFTPFSVYDDVDMPYGSPAEFARTYAEWMQGDDGADYERPADGETLEASAGAEAPVPPEDVAQQLRSELASRNRFYGLGNAYKLPAVLVAVALGEECFDVEHFVQANPDMVGLPTRDMWKFFVFQGQFQSRPYRLKCGMDWSKYGLRSAKGKGGSNAAGKKDRGGRSAREGKG